MITQLRSRCASPTLLAIVCSVVVGSSSNAQSLASSGDAVYVQDGFARQHDAGYYEQPGLATANTLSDGYRMDDVVQTSCDGCSGGGSGCSESYTESCDPCNDCYCECAPCCPPGVPFFVFGEFLYIRASDADVAHAQQQNGTGGAGTVPFGRIGTIDMDYEPAYRVGGGVCLDECSVLMFSYTRFDGDSAGDLVPPTIPGGGGAVGSLVHHPATALTGSIGPVDAIYEIDYQIADLMFRDVWRSGPCHVLNYSLGALYANIDQEFAQLGNFGGSLAGAINTATDIEFDGGGIKAGLDGERWLGGRLSVYGKASAAAVSGRFNSDYSMVNETTDALLAESLWKDNRVISIVEYEIGLAVTSCNQCWRLSAGYMFQHWGNMVTTSNFIDGVQADNYTDLSDVISFDGFVTRLEARF